jgi:CheY-like chemotaxis protein
MERGVSPRRAAPPMTSQPHHLPPAERLARLLDQASEALFCIALDPAPDQNCMSSDLLAHCLEHGRFEFANSATQRMFGFEALDPQDLALSDLPTMYGGGEGAGKLHTALETEGAVHKDVESGRITRIVGRIPMSGESSDGLESQRLQTAGLLVSGIAHDYHNLLTVMLGSAEIAMQQARHGDPTPHLEEIHAAARSAAALGQQLAALSYERDPELQPVELMPLMRRSVGMLRRLLDPSTRLTLEIDPEVPRVHADPRQLEQAMIGMVLSVRGALPVDAQIHVSAAEDEEHALVRLTVSGDHPLSSAVEVGGPGCAVARSVIERSGGRLINESSPAGGPALHAYLKHAQGRPRTLTEAREEVDGQGAGKSVLLVDDHDVLRHYMARLLRSFGYEVHAVSNAEEALSIPETERAGFALIVTDVLMPGTSGPELVKRWREGGLTTPAVFTSGASGSRRELERCLGKDWILLEKPFRNEELLAALRDARVD